MIQPDMREFLTFVQSRAPDQEYVFDFWPSCACGQFAEFIGVEKWVDLHGFWDVANELAVDTPHTFGALTGRVREYLGEKDTI
jgi:hypothetical protein